jgi:hypothetical protein
MFGKLKQMAVLVISFARRLFASGEDRFDTYRPREQLIYHFWDGQQMRNVDPVKLYKKMAEVGQELSANIQVSTSPSKGAAKAYEAVVRSVRSIFDLKAFEEGGLTEIDTVGLLDHFLIFCGRLKKNTSPSLTSSTSLADSKTSSADEGRPITSSSDSGSTANAPSIEKPALSLTEPLSPGETSNPETTTMPLSPTAK